MSVKTYQRYRSLGLCGLCGSSDVSEGKALCDNCLEKSRTKKAEGRLFSKQLGICTCCGTRKARLGRILCEDCSDKAKEYKTKNHDRILESERESYLKRRDKRMSEGICVKCGKRKSVEGKQYCGVCASKHSERSRGWRLKAGRMASELPRSEWIANGLCYICGHKRENPEIKLCNACKERTTACLAKANPNRDHWRKDNQLLKKCIDKSRL